MMHTKKFIGASSALIIVGASMISSVSAMSMESTDDGSSMSTSTESSTESSTSVAFPAVTMDGINKIQNPYERCLAYVKFKNISNVDCKAKTQSMRQEIKDDHREVKQEIKDEKVQIKQEIKDDRVQMKQENTENRQMMTTGANKPMPTGELKNFLKNPLTTEEQTALKTLLQSQQAERDAIMKDTALTPDEKTTKMKELTTTQMNALLAYIPTEKQEAFKKMVTDKVTAIEKNQELRQENKENRQEFKDGAQEKRQEFKEGAQEKRQELKTQVQAKKQALSEKNKAILTKAVSSLSLERLQTILSKVEKAISATKKERVLAQLNEINDLVQSKIDELTGTSSEDDVLSDILGTDSTTTTNTETTTITQ